MLQIILENMVTRHMVDYLQLRIGGLDNTEKVTRLWTNQLDRSLGVES